MKIKDLMTTEVGTCAPDDNLSAVVSVMWAKDCGAVPVLDGGKVVGMITDRDICVAAATTNLRTSEIPVKAVLLNNEGIYSCTPEDSAEAALTTMQQYKVRRLPVVDAAGTLCGIVSVSDLVQRAGKTTSVKANTVAQKEVLTTLKALTARA